MGDGGSMKAGRDYYTMGAGRIIGSSDWNNQPSSHSGIWYNHDMDGMNMSFAMLNTANGESGYDNGGDDMLYVLSMDYALEAGALGTINLTPYAMRDESQDSRNWQGAFLSGELMGFGYDAEYSQYNSNTGTEGTAWAIATSLDLEFLATIPGISNGGVDIAFSSADSDFDTNGPVQHGVGGFADYGTGGTWDDGKNTTSFGLNFSPAEGWNGRISLNETTGDTSNYSETDISLGHDFNGNVSGWFGYGMVNDDAAGVDNSVVFWTTLNLAF
jgi:hypothetical protein